MASPEWLRSGKRGLLVLLSVPRQHQWHRSEVVIQGGLGLRRSDEGTKMKTQLSLKKCPPKKAPADRVLKDIWRATRRHFSAEDKIRMVLDGLLHKPLLGPFREKSGPRGSSDATGLCKVFRRTAHEAHQRTAWSSGRVWADRSARANRDQRSCG